MLPFIFLPYLNFCSLIFTAQNWVLHRIAVIWKINYLLFFGHFRIDCKVKQSFLKNSTCIRSFEPFLSIWFLHLEVKEEIKKQWHLLVSLPYHFLVIIPFYFFALKFNLGYLFCLINFYNFIQLVKFCFILGLWGLDGKCKSIQC